MRSYGDSANPVLMIAPGSLSDIRAYMPFTVFQDRYFVVLWDMRGWPYLFGKKNFLARMVYGILTIPRVLRIIQMKCFL